MSKAKVIGKLYSPVSYNGDVEEFEVVRRTPCFFWDRLGTRRKIVSRSGIFYETRQEAIDHIMRGAEGEVERSERYHKAAVAELRRLRIKWGRKGNP